MSERRCPKCGGVLRWERRGTRSVGYCACNSVGPVLDAPLDAQDVAVLGAELFEIPGFKRELVGALVDRGLLTFDDLNAATDAQLLAVSGIGPVRLQQLRRFLVERDCPF